MIASNAKEWRGADLKPFCGTKLPWKGGPHLFTFALVTTYLASRIVSISDDFLAIFSLNFPTDKDEKLSEAQKHGITIALRAISKESDALGLKMTKLAADRLAASVSTATGGEIDVGHADLRQRFQDEVETIQFLYLGSDKMAYYDQTTLFGQTVADRFPSVEYDIRESGSCLATGRYTAAVMHAMRVLEVGITALGSLLKEKRGPHGWGNDLKSFEQKWQQMATAKPPMKLGWKRYFVPQLLLHFRYFADAWRNRAFHSNHAKYGETEARQVLDHVRDFMQLLATRLSEKKRKS